MKYHPNRSVIFVTFSVEEGLLLLCNPLCLAIIQSCLATAQNLYPVTICHFVVEATHLHLIVVVQDPEDLPAFIGHFKTESAHMLNRLLGRSKRTIWCEGYDSPVVLTMNKALAVITYIYTNPAKDNLVKAIDDYPGFSSWKMFQTGQLTGHWKRLRRPLFSTLKPGSHNLRGYTRTAEQLLEASNEIETFTLAPNAWLEAFDITDPLEQRRVNARMIKLIRYIEDRRERKREKERKQVIGRERLISQRFDLSYRPNRTGRRMWCLSDDRSLRVSYIRFLKKLKQEARRVLALWRAGDTSVRYPPGLHPPSMPRLANVIAA